MTNAPLTVKLPAIVFTDLDGTLLDHNTYDWQPARPALEKLNAMNIPVVFNTSKTRAELLYWQKKTGNRHPFIVENGSAIFIPNHYPQATNNPGDCECIELGIKRSDILRWLQQNALAFGDCYKSFVDLSVNELVQLTDLPPEQAQLALQREYSEAVHWLGDEKKKQLFIQAAMESGFRVLVGGRFIHLLGCSDKGKASAALLSHLNNLGIFGHQSSSENEQHALTTISCGDSPNDIDMLQWSDLAILVRSHKPAPPVKHKNLIYTQALGPAGFAEAINSLTFVVQ